ncbi:MAG: transcription factor [Candidatus Bathyarchaeia archaeon]|nr:transcription factor [Candidatus Bathyarchaeota archaeon]
MNSNEENLLELVEILGGEEGVEIVKALRDSGDVTVEELSAKTGIQINNVRKLLYKLYNHSLVMSRRSRDKDTGWFIFQWRLQPELVDAYILGVKQKILKKLKTRLEYEQQHEFYHCGSSSCPKVTFEEAMETVFKCLSCGKPLHPIDNTSSIDFLRKKIDELEKELKA